MRAVQHLPAARSQSWRNQMRWVRPSLGEHCHFQPACGMGSDNWTLLAGRYPFRQPARAYSEPVDGLSSLLSFPFNDLDVFRQTAFFDHPRLSSVLSMPIISSGGTDAYSYSCCQWTSVGGLGGSPVEHMISAHGTSHGSHHLQETVTDGRTGRVRVLRNVRNPALQFVHAFLWCSPSSMDLVSMLACRSHCHQTAGVTGSRPVNEGNLEQNLPLASRELLRHTRQINKEMNHCKVIPAKG